MQSGIEECDDGGTAVADGCGLGDSSVEGTYVWTSGESMSYSNWSSGEPNNFNGNEDCSEILTSGQWNDMDCTTTRAYVCEFAYP